MKKNLMLVSAIVLLTAGSVVAREPLDDYSFVRGVCYGVRADQATLERDLGYAQKLYLNSTRVWLSYRSYEQDPEGYLKRLQNYVRTAYRYGITTMPVLFNGNSLDPAILEDDFQPVGEAYVRAIVDALKNEEGLLIWDIMNQPSYNEYLGYQKIHPEVPTENEQKVWDFVRHYCMYVKEIDPVNAITVGHYRQPWLVHTADLVDVLCFHDYSETREKIDNYYMEAKKISKQYNKPLINSELGCICRANTYDMALEICERYGAGWYVFDLIIDGYWGDAHGLVYPDGTIRDPSIVAALFGFYRNRDLNTIVKPNPNKEGRANIAIELIETALTDETAVFQGRRTPTDVILDAAEYAANLLEAGEMVPMYEPPTAKIMTWRAQPPEERDEEAIRIFAYELGLTLKKWCHIY